MFSDELKQLPPLEQLLAYLQSFRPNAAITLAKDSSDSKWNCYFIETYSHHFEADPEYGGTGNTPSEAVTACILSWIGDEPFRSQNGGRTPTEQAMWVNNAKERENREQLAQAVRETRETLAEEALIVDRSQEN